MATKDALLPPWKMPAGPAAVVETVVHTVQNWAALLNPLNLLPDHHHGHGHDGELRPLSQSEILDHPEYPHVNWPLEPTSKGKVEVADGRGGPFKISYQLHGHGPKKIIVRS